MTPVEASQQLITKHGWPSGDERKMAEEHVADIIREMQRRIAAGGNVVDRIRSLLIVRVQNLLHQRNEARAEVARLRNLVETMDGEINQTCRR